jgi:hypothetical protein
MSKIGYFAVGCLAGAATVVTAALIADAIEQSDAFFGEDEGNREVEIEDHSN